MDSVQKYGVKCYECQRYIGGKVLQAGQYKFHPTCARCTRCGNHFGDGQEMFIQVNFWNFVFKRLYATRKKEDNHKFQGNEIWHSSCDKFTTENLAVSLFPKIGFYAKTEKISLESMGKFEAASGCSLLEHPLLFRQRFKPIDRVIKLSR
jgi:hypothetical protein